MATVSASATFKCRKCRTLLFTSKDLSKNHEQGTECSSWYLKDDDMLPWVEVLVDEVSRYRAVEVKTTSAVIVF